MNLDFDFNTIVIPIASSLVGLIPMLISLGVGAMEKRSQKARIDAILRQVNNRVGFLTAWYNLQKEVSDTEYLCEVKLSVNEELADVYELFIDAVLDPDKDTKQRKEAIANYRRTNKARRFLLLYTPYNIRGWIFHTFYYMCSLPVIASVVYMINLQIQHNDPLYGIPNENLVLFGMAFLLIFIFRWLGRESAKEIEERMVKVDQKTMPLRARRISGTKDL